MKRAKGKRKISVAGEGFLRACAEQWPGGVREHAFALPDRKWCFDMAWPARMVALELEGAVYKQGRHTRGRGYEDDCEKYSVAAIKGWRVIRVTPGMINRRRAWGLVEAAMRAD